MKRIVHLMMLLALAFGQACEGPAGPEGPPGPTGAPGATGSTGPAGPATVARVVEFPADFELNQNVGYAAFVPFEEYEDVDLTISDSDVVLVYAHTLTAGASPNQVLFWSPLPLTLTTAQGAVVYNFAYSELALILLASAPFDLATTPALITDRLFRLVIIPGEAMLGRVAESEIDFNNYTEVAKHYNFTEKDVRKLKLK